MRRLRVGQDAAPAGVKPTQRHALGWSGVTVRPHYGGLPLARLDAVRVKAEKSVGWLSCERAPSTRKNGPSARENVAVARRKALRGSGLLAIQPARTASSPLNCA